MSMIMPTPAYTIICTKKTLVAPGVYELRFTRPEGMSFKAGQFVLFDVPLAEDPTDIQTRAFSIASAPDEKDLLFCVKLKDGGRASTWIELMVQEKSSIRIQGPFGLFLLKETDPAFIFIATGAGIAPFRSQLLWMLEERKDTRPMHLLFGVRHTQDFFWLKDFQSLALSYQNFFFHPVLSGDDVSWTGLRGRVQKHLPRLNIAHPDAGIYICGAPEMVKDVKETCLTDFGIPKIRLHAEGYI